MDDTEERKSLKLLVTILQEEFGTKGIKVEEFKDYVTFIPNEKQLPHALWMLEQLSLYIEEWDLGKISRWIGFIQGYFSAHDVISIERLRDINRSCLK